MEKDGKYMDLKEFLEILCPTDDGYFAGWFDMENGHYLLVRAGQYDFYERTDEKGKIDFFFDVFEYSINKEGKFNSNPVIHFFDSYDEMRKFMDSKVIEPASEFAYLELKEENLINEPIPYLSLPDQSSNIFKINLTENNNWEKVGDNFSCLVDMENGYYLRIFSTSSPKEMRKAEYPGFFVVPKIVEGQYPREQRLVPCTPDFLFSFSSMKKEGETAFLASNFDRLIEIMEIVSQQQEKGLTRIVWPGEEKLPVVCSHLKTPRLFACEEERYERGIINLPLLSGKPTLG